MIAIAIILIAILTFLQARRRVTTQRRYPPVTQQRLTKYSHKQLQVARADRRVHYW